MQEDDALIWSLYGSISIRKRLRLLRTLRRQYRADLTDARAEVVALRQRLRLIDNAIRDYMLGGKQGRRRMTLSGWTRLWIAAVSVATLSMLQASAQPTPEDKNGEDARMRFLLLNADVVGFQTTGGVVQVLYRAQGIGTLILCSWKTPSKPVATGCVVLPQQ